MDLDAYKVEWQQRFANLLQASRRSNQLYYLLNLLNLWGIASPPGGRTTGSSMDFNVEVNRAEIYVNGGLKVTFIGTGPYQFDWRVSGKKNKVYEITAKAYDPSGNVGIDQISVEAR